MAKRAIGAGGDGAAFDAFISYSHAADGALAPAVRRGLEQLARPWRRRRALRVFQDKVGLSASPHLWESIETALHSSRYFVLLASPEAAASPWVRKEVDSFVETFGVERLLIVLTNGALQWEATSREFSAASDALPPSLFGRFSTEPLWVDLRWAATEAHLDVDNPRFRSAMADLAAPIHGLPRDELDAEDLREHRRALRARRAAVGVIAVLALAASASAVTARANADSSRENARRAQENADAAGRNAERADALRLGAQARNVVTTETDLGMLLALESLAISPNDDAYVALSRGLTTALPSYAPLGDNVAGALDLAISPDGRRVASAGLDGFVRVWSAATGDADRSLRVPDIDGLRHVAFVDDAHVLFSASTNEVSVWDLNSDATQKIEPASSLPATVLEPLLGNSLTAVDSVSSSPLNAQTRAVDAGGGTVAHVRVLSTDLSLAAAMLSQGPFLRSIVVTKQGRRTEVPLGAVADGLFEPVVAVSPAGTFVAVGSDASALALVDASTGSSTTWALPAIKSATSLVFSPDERRLAVLGRDGRVELRDVATGDLVQTVTTRAGTPRGAAFSRGGAVIVVGGSNGIDTVDLASGVSVGALLAWPSLGVIVDREGSLWSAATDGVRRWDPDAPRLMPAVANPGRPVLEAGRLIDATGVSSQTTTTSARQGPTRAANATDSFGPNTLFEVRKMILGTRLQVSAQVGDIVVADKADGREIRRWPSGQYNIQSLAMDAAETTLITGEENGLIRVWDIASGAALERPLAGHTSRVLALAFSADGRLFASGDRNGNVLLWTRTGARLDMQFRFYSDVSEVPVKTTFITGIEFSDDDKSIRVTNNVDAQLTWPGPAAWPALACQVAGRNLTAAERTRYLGETASRPPQC